MGNSRTKMWYLSCLVLCIQILLGNAQTRERCEKPVDLVFALDASGSVKKEGFQQIKQFTKDIVSDFKISVQNTHCGVLTFSEQAEVQIKLTETFKKDELLQMIDRLDYAGYRTATDDALRVANTEFFSVSGGARQDVTQVLIFLTDGKCTLCTETVREAAQPLKDKGVKIYVIGVTNNVDVDELISIASSPDTEYLFQVSDFGELRKITQELQNGTCNQKVGKCAKPLPPFVCNINKKECLSDESCPNKQKCCFDGCSRQCKFPLLNCLTSVEIAFALDSSSSVSDKGFGEMKSIANQIVDSFQVSQTEARFSALVYSSTAELGFDFITFDTANQVKEQIRNLPHLKTSTRIDKALELANDEVFSLDGNVRTRRPRILIVFYDGVVTSRMKDLEEVALPLKQHGVKIIAIGVGPELNFYQMRKITTNEDSIFQASNFGKVLPEIYNIAKQACNEKPGQCEAENQPVNPALCQGEVDECQNDLDCYGSSKCCRKGCSKKCTKQNDVCRRKIDIAFAVHQNMMESELEITKFFINSLIDRFEVGFDKTHVALMSFGRKSEVVFDFNLDQSDNKRMRDRVDGLSYNFGVGKLTDLLELACDSIFCAAGGTRSQVPKMLVVITAGLDPSPPDELKQRIETLRRRNVDVLAIGTGGAPSASLQALTSDDPTVVNRVMLTKEVAGALQYAQDIADFACGEAGTLPPIGGITEEKGGCKPKTCYKGPKGSRGRPGKLGQIGEPGIRGGPGPKGIQGAKGVKGPDGTMGAKGVRGPDGIIGLPGFPGYDGIFGTPGIEGRRGKDGDCGMPGAAGNSGPPGLDGFPGTIGRKGPVGVKGEKGPPAVFDPNLIIEPGEKGDFGELGELGIKGVKGVEGDIGPLGDDGADGNDGVFGELGDMGDVGTFIRQRGQKGERGDQGPPGESDNTVPGGGEIVPSGDIGSKGQKGEQGDQGIEGKASIFQGLAGQRGGQGPEGDAGSKGEPGNAGNVGDIGDRGPKGMKGDLGLKGRDGRDGRKGVKGRPGPEGDSGKLGDPGDDGEAIPGPLGKKGEQGESGIKGQLGPIGRRGPAGPKGKQGDLRIGSPGDRGGVGPRGQRGENGMPGEPGMIGVQGGKGLKGNQGSRGDQGKHGELMPGNPGMTGPPGPKGVRGPIGDTGVPGIRGKNVTVSCKEEICPKGQKGLPGAPGDGGLPGDRGSAGIKGSKGFDGGPCPTCPEGEQGESGIAGNPGMPGKAGEKGSLGDTGPFGIKGLLGPEGAKGRAGVEGAKGVQGDIGPIGPNGDDADGAAIAPKGEKGSTGDIGKTGDPGPPGVKGDNGLPGAKGEDGDRGPRGPKGSIGLTGESGADGLSGAIGRFGQKGVSIRGTEGEKGNVGPEGDQGPIGDQGSIGARGPKGSPPTDEEMKKMKENMAGDRGARGPSGDQGDPGPPGPIGPLGPRGPPGERGSTGRQGFGGIKGDAGSAGPKGEIGDPGIPGFPGKPGMTGSPGNNGPAGKRGQTPRGEPGMKGESGLDGRPGVDAPPPIGCFTFADPTDIAFLLDTSSSVDDENFVRQKEFVKNILREFPVSADETAAGVIKYGNTAEVGINFNDFFTRRGLFDAIDGLKHLKDDDTRLDLALKAAKDLFTPQRGARPDVKKALIILGDGFINGKGLRSKELAEQARVYAGELRDNNINIFAIGVGPEKNTFLLKDFVSEESFYLQIESYAELQTKLGALQNSFQAGCTSVGEPGKDGFPGYPGNEGDAGEKGMQGMSPQGPQGDKGAKGATGDAGVLIPGIPGDSGIMGFPGDEGSDGLDGKDIPGPDGFPGARGDRGDSIPGVKGLIGEIGPMGPQGEASKKLCDSVLAVDLLFLLDTSRSVTQEAFEKMKEFIQNIIRNFDVDAQLTRISVITYDSDARLMIKFSDYNSEKSILAAIDRLNVKFGTATRIDKALLAAYSEAFTARNGARDGVGKALVLLTDGQQSFALDQVDLADAVKPLIDRDVARYAIGIGQEISEADLVTVAGDNIVFATDYATLARKVDVQIALIGRRGCRGDAGKPGAKGQPGEDGLTGLKGERGSDGTRGPIGPAGPKGNKGFPGENIGRSVKGQKGDDGEEGPVGLPACDNTGGVNTVATDLLFAIDASGSLYPEGYLQEKQFIKNIIDSVGPVSFGGLRVGVIVYSFDAETHIRLDEYFDTDKLKSAIDALPYASNMTRMDLALVKAKELFTEKNGGRGSSKKVLILMTDGQQSYVPGVTEPSEKAKDLATDGVDIFAIGIGQEIDRTELEALISKPQYIFLVENISQLVQDLLGEIQTALTCEGGPRGPDGRTGDDGPPGSEGPIGPIGKQGFKGEPGEPGFGIKGESGDPGPIGPQGDKGEKGFRGPEGIIGFTGSEGLKGFDGPRGEKGEQGLDGFIGYDGEDGPVGPKGEAGDSLDIKGDKGEAGEKGLPGPIGDPGKLPPGNTMDDYKGEKGGQGIKGKPGAAGKPGRFVTKQGPDGLTGLKGKGGDEGDFGFGGDSGIKGIEGEIGPDGNPGGQGEVGIDGVGGIKGVDGDFGLGGDQGEKGQKGERGMSGNAGIRGPEGAKGELGFPGFLGMDGKKGERGEAGPKGRAQTTEDSPRLAKGQKGFIGFPGLDGDNGMKGEPGDPGDIVRPLGESGDNGDIGPTGPRGPKGEPGLSGMPGFEGAEGPKGRAGTGGDPGPEGPRGRKGIPGDLLGGSEKGDAGENGLKGRAGPKGMEGMNGMLGPKGPIGRQGSKGAPGEPGFPGLRGPEGSRGPDGSKGLTGDQGPKGQPGPGGKQGPSGIAEGFYIVRHSQDSTVPPCPRNYKVLWQGYSLMYTVGNGQAHSQDLGNAGSCVKSFSTLPFLFCQLTGSCNYASRNDFTYWLSGDVQQPMMPVSNSAIEPFVSRCIVCEAPSVHIAVHSQDTYKPSCPRGWESLWDGFSFMMVAGAGSTGAGQSLSSSGSCLESFRAKPFIECQGARGTCHFFSDKYSFWLTTIDPTKEFQTQEPQTLSQNKGDDLTSRVSRCRVCVRRSRGVGNVVESNNFLRRFARSVKDWFGKDQV